MSTDIRILHRIKREGRRAVLRDWGQHVSYPNGRKGCWVWTGVSNPRTGHGHFGGIGAYRAAWILFNGPIPNRKCEFRRLVVRHRCDIPPCVNPKHLELGTHGQNCRDRFERSGKHVAYTAKQERRVLSLSARGRYVAEIEALTGLTRITIRYIRRGGPDGCRMSALRGQLSNVRTSKAVKKRAARELARLEQLHAARVAGKAAQK